MFFPFHFVVFVMRELYFPEWGILDIKKKTRKGDFDPWRQFFLLNILIYPVLWL